MVLILGFPSIHEDGVGIHVTVLDTHFGDEYDKAKSYFSTWCKCHGNPHACSSGDVYEDVH